MYYLEHEPETMASILRGLIRRFLASRISTQGLSGSNHNSSYSYLPAAAIIHDDKLRSEEATEKTPSLETSFSGL